MIEPNCRVLIIDDNKAIHDDIRKILCSDRDVGRSMKLAREIVGTPQPPDSNGAIEKFEIDSCYQGIDGIERVRQARAEHRPYAFVLVDVRMPPGFDGVETLSHIWDEDPDVQAVICTAYSDYSWEQIKKQLGNSDRLLILKKPFDRIELRQMASASVTKWNLSRQSHQAMVMLQENRDRLFTTLQSIGDAVIATDSLGRIIEMNPVAEELAGCKKAEVLNRTADEVLKFVDQENKDINPITQVLKEGHIIDLPEDARLLRNDGSSIPVADCGAPIISNMGMNGAVMVFRDMTEHRKAQQEIRRLYHEAIEANRVKDEFLAVLSHELRTPLTSIMGWLYHLRKGNLDYDKTRRAIEVIDRNARVQCQLIEDLLDISRIVSGKLKLEFKESDVSEVLHRVVEQFTPGAEAKSVAIHLFEPAPVPQVSADSTRIHQIVANLVSNALKFTPPGGRIDVHLLYLAQVDSIQIVVRDTGKGITSEFLPHVFERFRQEEISNTRSYGGLGLGLAIVNELVSMHGGSIRAESEGVGRGATFTVTIPVHHQP